jgi:hypothetical protein
MFGRFVTNDLEKIWNQTVVFEVVCYPYICLGGTIEYHDVSLYNRYPGLKLNSGPPGYELGVLATLLQYSSFDISN